IFCSTVNLALGKKATQSHAKSLVVANRAIDGNKNSNAKEGSCSQSNIGINPWWMVDLKQPYFVAFVRITNRMDCCSDHLLGAEVRLGNKLGNNGKAERFITMVTIANDGQHSRCALTCPWDLDSEDCKDSTLDSHSATFLISFRCGVVDVVAAKTLTLNCGGLIGDYVHIVIPGMNKSLALCEVEVFALGDKR
ncbi:fucolectin-like, partial [Leucoraja erinacea]|uniref:fucolectin-like n=1 Tax=Leucoraja erinaceus TaxID=7782 RepID=UPI002454B794